ncbi:hypothetical protein ALI144C_34935 [Actinosynnema sp. ALI-1.44]|nr:hypothetical protein ALI144C_34935 [Actinosynnema sp. ALI-1.44]
MFMSAEAIYQNFTDARGGRELADAAEIVRKLVKEYEQQADEIIGLAGAMESAWQGEAAGVAQRGAGALAIAHAQAAPSMHVTQDLSMRQVASFEDARNSVQPIPPEPTVPDPWMMVTSLDASATYAGQVAAYNAAAQHNVDVMSGYDNASTYNTSRLPSSYGALIADDAGVSVGTAASPPPPRVGDGRPSPGRTPPPGVQPPGAGPSDHRPAPGDGPVAAPPLSVGDAPPQQTDPGSSRPAPDNRVSSVPSAATNASSTGASGAGAGSLGTGGVLTGSPGSTSASSPDRPGTGHRFGGGPGARGGTGAEAGARSVAGRGAGQVGGITSGEGGPAARAGGVRGGLGVVPVSGAAPGRGRSAEDEEHQRLSYLRDPDPEKTFGTDERTTPPVIE